MYWGKLVELCRNRRVFIQTHNFPDPDAVSSAFGLQYFLKQYGIDAILCYAGKIEKLNTKRMLSVFDIDMMYIDDITDMTQEDYIITVDAQKYNANISIFPGHEIACIDHHPTFIDYEYEYKDVRICGACASIVAKYYEDSEIPIPENVASALLYGIKVDTAELSRGVADLDIDMFYMLYKLANLQKIASLYSNAMELDDLKAYGAAFESITILEEIGFASIPFNCHDALIATISDFILSLDVVECAVVYAIREDGIKFSVRSDMTDVDAGRLTEWALGGVGTGGGHFSMAGGFVQTSNVDKFGRNLHKEIESRFVKALKILR